MIFRIRRFHILILIVGLCVTTGAWIFSKESSDHLPRALELKPLKPGRLPQVLSPVPPAKHNVAALLQPIPSSPIRIKKVSAPPSLYKTIAFTFDDGPHPYYTERLLKILKDSQVHATFFVVGKQVEKHPELLQLIFRDGHEIANHTYSHRDMRSLSPNEITQELEKTEALVRAVTDQRMRFFRPPGGRYNETVVERAKETGYDMVLWSVLPQDHLNPSADLIRRRILRSAQSHDVVLLHSGVKHTLEILPELIAMLKKKGFSFVTVSRFQAENPLTVLAKNKPQ